MTGGQVYKYTYFQVTKKILGNFLQLIDTC